MWICALISLGNLVLKNPPGKCNYSTAQSILVYDLVWQHSSVSVITARECSSYYKSSHGPNYIRCNHDTPGSCSTHVCVECAATLSLSLSTQLSLYLALLSPFQLSLSHNYLVPSACVCNWFLCELWKCWMWVVTVFESQSWLLLQCRDLCLFLPCYYLHYCPIAILLRTFCCD